MFKQIVRRWNKEKLDFLSSQASVHSRNLIARDDNYRNVRLYSLAQ